MQVPLPYLVLGSVHIRDSQLSDNFAREGGSAINNNRDGTVTITGTTVSGDPYEQ
jgi:hypothetical protein